MKDELAAFSVVVKFATAQNEGGKMIAFSKMDKNSVKSILNSILELI